MDVLIISACPRCGNADATEFIRTLQGVMCLFCEKIQPYPQSYEED